MAFGVQLSNAQGVRFFDSTKQTWNFLASLILQPNTSGNFPVPQLGLISEIIIQRSAVDAPPNSQEGYIHYCFRGGSGFFPDATKIYYYGGNVKTHVVILGR